MPTPGWHDVSTADQPEAGSAQDDYWAGRVPRRGCSPSQAACLRSPRWPREPTTIRSATGTYRSALWRGFLSNRDPHIHGWFPRLEVIGEPFEHLSGVSLRLGRISLGRQVTIWRAQ